MMSLAFLMFHFLTGCKAPEGAQSCNDYAKVPATGTSFLYDHQTIQNIQIVITESNLSKLPTIADQDVEVPADITINGVKFYDVGLKLKGHASFRSIDEKASFKIDFDQFVDGQNFNGIKALTLNNMIQDPSKVSENLGYATSQELGLVSPRQGYTCVSVNGQDYGLYSIIEALDEQFVDFNFDDNSGVLYEGSGADFNKAGLDKFELQEGDDPDRAYLNQLITELQATNSQTYWAFIQKRFNADDLMLAFALQTYLGNRDNYLTWINNYYVYYEPSSEKWTFIPWGLDQFFDPTLSIANPLADRPNPGLLFTKCLKSAECKDEYYAKMGDINDLFDGGPSQDYLLTELDRIYSLSRHDPMDEVTGWKVDGDENDVLDFIYNRPTEFYSR